MSSSSSLENASKYLNNLLLSRGLLQNTKPIPFHDLTLTCDQSNTTTTSIINLIHTLILRTDRATSHLEALGSEIHNLRTEASQHTLDIQKQQDKNIILSSSLVTAETATRQANVLIKKREAEIKDWREQNAKLKSTNDQIRAKCINDVRKRDIEIEKLKRYLADSDRGLRASRDGGRAEGVKRGVHRGANNRGSNGKADETEQSQWTLENESSDFLAQVVNETSAENVALRKIVGDTMQYLRSLTGLDEEPQQTDADSKDLLASENAIGIPGRYRDRVPSPTELKEANLIPVQSLATSMTETLGQVQYILRDPSFVSVEEVHIRDAEIIKLRAGWEKMADRWKEAVGMMGTWRARMSDEQGVDNRHTGEQTGEQLSDEISGMRSFGRSIAVRSDGRPILDAIEEEELTCMLMEHHSRLNDQSILSRSQTETPDMNQPDSTIEREAGTSGEMDKPHPSARKSPVRRKPEITIHEDESPQQDSELKLALVARNIASPARRGIKLGKSPGTSELKTMRQPLSSTGDNTRKRRSSLDRLPPCKRMSVSPPPETNTQSLSVQPRQYPAIDLDQDTSDEDSDPPTDIFAPTPAKSNKPKLTVAQKLAAVEAEATEVTEVIRKRQALSTDDRRARAKLRDSLAPAVLTANGTNPSSGEAELSDSKTAAKTGAKTEAKRSVGNVRQANVQGLGLKASKARRRSTLTAKELGQLLGQA